MTHFLGAGAHQLSLKRESKEGHNYSAAHAFPSMCDLDKEETHLLEQTYSTVGLILAPRINVGLEQSLLHLCLNTCAFTFAQRK
jgi:hypothetical protein